jgi:hypothetical protein
VLVVVLPSLDVIHVYMQSRGQRSRFWIVQRLTGELGVDVATSQSCYPQFAADVRRTTARQSDADVAHHHVVPEPCHGWKRLRFSHIGYVRILQYFICTVVKLLFGALITFFRCVNVFS